MNDEVGLVEFDKEYLELSRKWLSDPVLAELVQTRPIDIEEQRIWYDSLRRKTDYYVFGVRYLGCPVGVVGIKNVERVKKVAEYFGYIGNASIRNKGIGTAMMYLIENYARKLGIRKLYLHVTKNNIAAIALYKKMGYVLDYQEETVNSSTLTYYKNI